MCSKALRWCTGGRETSCSIPPRLHLWRSLITASIYCATVQARTPQSAAPVAVQMTFQDFLKEVDLQFLDHMRRGTSINFADLASDPPPATLQVRPPHQRPPAGLKNCQRSPALGSVMSQPCTSNPCSCSMKRVGEPVTMKHAYLGFRVKLVLHMGS